MKSAILPTLVGILTSAPALAQPETTAVSIRNVATANREATFRPAPSGFIGGAQVYPWCEGTIYIAYTAPGLVTDIVLQPGESLIAVASGDTARWVIGDTTSGSGETKQTHLLVKPFSGGLVTKSCRYHRPSHLSCPAGQHLGDRAVVDAMDLSAG